MKKTMMALGMLVAMTGSLHAAPQVLKMKIDGMTCGNCEAKVKKQLSALCKDYSVSYKTGDGSCTYDAPTTVDQVTAAVTQLGYKVMIVK